MVRFLDNFSGGRRGAATCEALLKQGCAVVFCHRKHSLEPFIRTLPTGTRLLAMLADSNSDTGEPYMQWQRAHRSAVQHSRPHPFCSRLLLIPPVRSAARCLEYRENIQRGVVCLNFPHIHFAWTKQFPRGRD